MNLCPKCGSAFLLWLKNRMGDYSKDEAQCQRCRYEFFRGDVEMKGSTWQDFEEEEEEE